MTNKTIKELFNKNGYKVVSIDKYVNSYLNEKQWSVIAFDEGVKDCYKFIFTKSDIKENHVNTIYKMFGVDKTLDAKLYK